MHIHLRARGHPRVQFCVCLQTYITMYIYLCVYIPICIYVYIPTCMYIYLGARGASTYIYNHVYISVCIYTYMYVYIPIHVCTYTYMHVYITIHACTYTSEHGVTFEYSLERIKPICEPRRTQTLLRTHLCKKILKIEKNKKNEQSQSVNPGAHKHSSGHT